MCGRFQLLPSPQVEQLCQILKVEPRLAYSKDIAPAAPISIIHERDGKRLTSTAIWWLLLDQNTLKPNYRYPSFNTRADKLNIPGSLGYQPVRTSRCIIPASAFIEGLGDKKTYHQIERTTQCIAFGGLFKTYMAPSGDDYLHSASIITLPPPVEWCEVFPKSIPLMLNIGNQVLLNDWLNPHVNEIAALNVAFDDTYPDDQLITPIKKPSTWEKTAPGFALPPIFATNAAKMLKNHI